MLSIKSDKIAAIYDDRYTCPVDITDGSGRFGQPVYTGKSQDITGEDKPPFTPYIDHSVPYTETEGAVLLNRDFGVSLKAEEADGGVVLDLTFTNETVSA